MSTIETGIDSGKSKVNFYVKTDVIVGLYIAVASILRQKYGVIVAAAAAAGAASSSSTDYICRLGYCLRLQLER